jgi:hypothetical protein
MSGLRLKQKMFYFVEFRNFGGPWGKMLLQQEDCEEKGDSSNRNWAEYVVLYLQKILLHQAVRLSCCGAYSDPALGEHNIACD